MLKRLPSGLTEVPASRSAPEILLWPRLRDTIGDDVGLFMFGMSDDWASNSPHSLWLPVL